MPDTPVPDKEQRTMIIDRFTMPARRAATAAGSRICKGAVSAVAAAAMLLASSAITATAATTYSSDSSAIVGATAYSDAPRNFVINLGTTAKPLKSGQFEHAVSLIQTLGAVPLAQYPQIGVLFAQSTDADFARELADQLTASGIPFHSVAASRSTDTVKKDGSDVVQGSEIVVPSATGLSGRANDAGDEASPEAAEQGETRAPDGTSQVPVNRMTIDPESDNRLGSSGVSGKTTVSGGSATDPDVGDGENAAWGIKAIHADAAYTSAVSTISRTVTVGILDSGIDDTHADLKANIDSADSAGCTNNGIAQTDHASWTNYKTASGTYDDVSATQITEWSHATHVAGIVGAAHNGSGVQGVDPQARLASVRVANSSGNIWSEYVVCGVMWSASKHFAVTNNSYSGFVKLSDVQGAAQYEALRRAFAYAQSQNVMIVAAAGNNNVNLDAVASAGWRNIPGDFPGVVTVSNVELTSGNALGRLERYAGQNGSNYGAQHIDIAAPGTDILSTCPKAYYSTGKDPIDTCSMTGTSMAVPHVVGVTAILRSIFPKATVDGITSMLKSEAKTEYGRLQPPNPSSEEYRGAGLVNALAALGGNALSISGTSMRVPVYRLYNPYSKYGLHHLTTSVQERDRLISLGWKLDGTVFVAVSKNSTNAVPVYREYNPNDGTHNWTLDTKEHQALVKLGWRDEGIAWYVRDDGQVPVWRLYNPYSGEHIYTRNMQEYATLKNNVGWRGEGLAWLGIN